jgi:mannan endo-1,4-beta-mannosidase
LYGLHVTRLPDSIGPGGLLWSVNDSGAVPVPAEVLFNMPGPRQGLRASYWGNEDWFGKPLFQQTTPFLLLVWPDRALPTNVFSARFTGALHIAQAGTYHFRVEVDDGARLSVDGKVLGEGLIPGQPNTFEVSADLDARDHPIEIDYVQNGGSNQLRFFWRTGDQPWTPVPPAALLPSP